MFFTGFITGLIFLLLQLFPPLGVILPIYKIKKLKYANLKTHIFVNAFALITIGIIDINFIYVYFAFLVPEVLYYFFEKYFPKIAIFDRINIISIFMTIALLASYYMIFKNLNFSWNEFRNIYEKNIQLSPKELENIFSYIKDYAFYLVFIYSIFVTFIMYWYLQRPTFYFWEISHYWLLPYICIFLLKHFGIFTGIYVDNLLKILQTMFIPYGMKSMSLVLLLRLKNNIVNRIITGIVFAFNPFFLFIFGGIFSCGNKNYIE